MSGIGQGPVGPQTGRLWLPEPLRRKIAAHVRRALPEEACGLLIGRIEEDRASVSACVESPNRAADPRTGFEIDPRLLLETQRHLRATGECVLGHYHSHPNGIAEPSETDRERAWVPGHVWLIVAEARDGHIDLTAHLAVEKAGRMSLRPLEIAAG